jgi:uncharacterized metal-binding protein
VGHTSECGGWMEKRLMAERSGGSLDHGGVACVVVKLPKVDRFDFKKIKSKNFKKGANPRLKTACVG